VFRPAKHWRHAERLVRRRTLRKDPVGLKPRAIIWALNPLYNPLPSEPIRLRCWSTERGSSRGGGSGLRNCRKGNHLGWLRRAFALGATATRSSSPRTPRLVKCNEPASRATECSSGQVFTAKAPRTWYTSRARIAGDKCRPGPIDEQPRPPVQGTRYDLG
jgi:hypothetical protein